MKIIVTHSSPDLDAITSVWLLKRFLNGWANADVKFVSAGTKLKDKNETGFLGKDNILINNNHEIFPSFATVNPIEIIDGNEVIHVDTGMGPLDHHQTNDQSICAASRTWDYICSHSSNEKSDFKKDAISRIVKVVVDIDHFREVFWGDPTADHHDFSLFGVLDGIKLQKSNQDNYYTDFIMQLLDALRFTFENKILAEKEIKTNSILFKTKWGNGIAFSSFNDTVIKLVQKMGYVVVVRKDPKKGYVRIKARPSNDPDSDVDLTSVYVKLKEIDSQASWFLHVSKKMLLNGSTKNQDMKPSSLSLESIIEILVSA